MSSCEEKYELKLNSKLETDVEQVISTAKQRSYILLLCPTLPSHRQANFYPSDFLGPEVWFRTVMQTDRWPRFRKVSRS